MLTIGEFSRICFVSKKTLRHYDEIGLLRPEFVAENGYRYYTVEQLRTMLLINRLKSYGFSLLEVGAVLAKPDGDRLAEQIEEKSRQLVQQMENTARILRQMQEDVEKLNRRLDIMELDIVVKQVRLEPQTVYGVRRNIDVKNFQELFGQLFAEIGQNRLQPLGPPMAFYYDRDFSPQDTDVEVAVPVAQGTAGGHILEGGEYALTTLLGPYLPEEFTKAYAGLMKWVEENGYQLCGAPFEKYVKGGPDCPPEQHVTEIYFPIAK